MKADPFGFDDLDMPIRGMNIAASGSARVKRAGKAQVWSAHVARLVDANLSLMGEGSWRVF